MPGTLRETADLLASLGLYAASGRSRRDDHLWLFTTNGNVGFSGNGKYQFLYSHHQDPDVRCVWIDADPHRVQGLRERGYEAHTPTEPEGRRLLRQGGVFFQTHGREYWPFTRNCRMVQLWHGVPLKRIGLDAAQDWDFTRRQLTRHITYRATHYLVPGGPAPERNLASGFGKTGFTPREAIRTGYPRNDPLALDDLPRYMQEEIPFDAEALKADRSRLVVYLPTWREWERDGDSALAWLRDAGPIVDALLEEHDAKLAIKLHPNADLPREATALRNVEVTPGGTDVNMLLRHADVLLTDYSSVMFDYLLLDRPMVLYAYDLERYRARRGFYDSYENVAPGPIARSTDALLAHLREALEGKDTCREKRQATRRTHYDVKPAWFSKQVHERVLKEIEN